MTDELDELSRKMAAHKAEEDRTLAFSERTLNKLKTHDNTNNQAKFLANICFQLDDRFDTGGALTLEWMIDHYLAGEYHNNISPLLNELYDMLVDGNHTCVNKWEHCRGYVYYIPLKNKDEWSSRKVLIMTNENNYGWDWLVIIDSNIISENVYVRKIWKKTRFNSINNIDQPTLSFYRKINFDLCYDNDVYGDCRDNGHIMTYESSVKWDYETKNKTKEVGKCDHSISFLRENLRWFFEVGSLHCEMEESS